MEATLDASNDYSTFSAPLDEPTKYPSASTASSWALDGAITPSLFGSLASGHGSTPSFDLGVLSRHRETNPFELTLSGSAKRHSVSSTAGNESKALGYKGVPHPFDLLSSSYAPSGGRKRALSSPAVCTPGGSSLDFLLPVHASAISTSDSFTLKSPIKRPRIDSLASSALSTTDRLLSGTERESDDSPASSVVATPPDCLTALPVSASPRTRRSKDIAVSSSFDAAQTMNPAPPASTFSLLSQLEQQRSAMIAAGRATLSQNMPLPMGANALDITVKAEAVEDSLTAPPAASGRAQEKKGKVPAPPLAGSAQSAVRASSDEGSPAPLPKRKGGRKKSSPAKEGEADSKDVLEDEDEDSLKRRQFLERNRVAACKSRQKKKEKTAAMERLAADLCSRNHVLQQTALALRQEALTLRQLMHAHQNCSCEHAHGYIERDQQGGGLATIDRLAGRTLHLNYSIPPSMGTEDDVYSFIDRGLAHPEPAPVAGLYTGAQLPGPAIPIVNKAVARSMSPAVPRPVTAASTSDSLTRSMMTRRAAAVASGVMGSDIAPTLVPSPLPPSVDLTESDFAGLEHLDMTAVLKAGMDRTAPISAVDPSTQAILDMPLAKHLRSSSAPPTTPGWDGAAPSGDYFAPKSVAGHA